MTLRLSRRRMLVAPSLALLPTSLARAASPTQVALLVPGLTNDASFNQAARDALQLLQAQGLIRLEVRQGMADPAAAEPVLQRYALRGTDLIIGHGIELSDSVLKVASLFPQVRFVASGGPDLNDRLVANCDGWTYDFGQFGYLAGFVAGRLANATTIGMVGGPQLNFVMAAHKGFRAGVRDSRPDTRFLEVFTGSFDDSQKAAEATRGMIAGGATLVWCSGDSMRNGVAAAASQAGIHTLGVTGDAGGMTRRVNVTSVVLDMTPVDRIYLDDMAAGRFGHRFIVSGIGNKGLVLTPINPVGGLVPASLPHDVAVLTSALDEAAVAHLMIGSPVQPASGLPEVDDQQTRLTIRGLHVREAGQSLLHDISLDVRRGEILGVAGVAGPSQAALAEAVVGLRRPWQGDVRLDGRPIGRASNAVRHGVAYVPEDRSLGLATELDLAANASLLRLGERSFQRFGFRRRGMETALARRLVERFDIRPPYTDGSAGSLSGGNQQKLLMARELEREPALIVLHGPTQGLDVAAAAAIRSEIIAAARRGSAILLISADLDEILALSHRIIVLTGGRITARFDRNGTLDVERLGVAMTSGTMTTSGMLEAG